MKTETAEAGGARWPVGLRSLRHRDFRWFWIGLLVSVTGTWMQMAAQGWLVYDLTRSPLHLGIVGACGSLPMLLFSLPGGVIADRFNKRRIVLVTQCLAALQAGLLALPELIDGRLAELAELGSKTGQIEDDLPLTGPLGGPPNVGESSDF